MLSTETHLVQHKRDHPALRQQNMRRIFCLAALCVSVLTAGKTTDQVIRRMEQHYNSARTLSVEFSETYSVQGHPRPTEAGTLTLRKQGKMLWNYSKPSGKVFLSDGKTVFLYSAAENRVEKLPLKDTEDMRAPLAFLLGRLDLKKEFQNFALRPEGEDIWLDAAAKNDKVAYEKIQMLVGPEGEVRKLNVVGRDQSLLSFTFEAEKVNPSVSDALFHFTIPPGAEIVDSVEYAGQGSQGNR